MAPTSLSKHMVIHNLHMLWMCTWMTPYHITAALIGQASYQIIENLCFQGGKPQRNALVEAMYSSKMATTSLSNTNKMFHNLYML